MICVMNVIGKEVVLPSDKSIPVLLVVLPIVRLIDAVPELVLNASLAPLDVLFQVHPVRGHDSLWQPDRVPERSVRVLILVVRLVR